MRDDAWTAGKDSFGAPQTNNLADFAKNPQFIVVLRKDANVFCQLSQMDGRLFQGEKYPFANIMQEILLCLFTLGDKESSLGQFDK